MSLIDLPPLARALSDEMAEIIGVPAPVDMSPAIISAFDIAIMAAHTGDPTDCALSRLMIEARAICAVWKSMLDGAAGAKLIHDTPTEGKPN